MACNLRLLLLAAIFISNCITWTASRHHYNHSISGHRIRHRRQGAGQYLSASYVLPGGEGSGWGAWEEISPCSRTCGGGVASQKRICLQIGPDGTPYCTGGNTKYFSCQTQDCPDPNEDFRAQQCSEFDDKEFRGYKYTWLPYTHVPNPCELTCMPQGERFYYRHKDKVIDGTRCNEDSFDVCVNGQCQRVGCDMMLGSKAVEDKCRVCRGNGESCRTYADIFDRQDLTQGYNDILLIPEGSTSILIEEIAPSRNYLALRAKDGDYYLNGHYHIDFPRSLVIAGALWNYERSPQGYMAPDRLRSLGPTTEPLYLSILIQEKNVGIKYEYSVPNTTAPPTDKQYIWTHEEFSPCSHKCGGGIQTRNVTCRSSDEMEIVDDGLCDDGLKPPTNGTCNPDPCPPQWVEGEWGNCSKKCGEGGVRSRVVRCEQIVANGHPSSIIDDNECLKALGPKPDLFEKCNENVACPTWFVGRWKPCDRLCDEGKQTRQVVCHQKVNGRVSLLDDEDCVDEKPEIEKSCFLYPCEGVDWVTSHWIGCDSCLSTNRTRTVVCATKRRVVLNDTFCSLHTKPVAQEACDPEKLPECEVQWYATQWSKCSVECGEGRQTRKVFCGVFDGESVQKVNDSKCAGQPRYNDTKVCVIPPEECLSQWFAGPWEKCSKDCDGGEQSRTVMCFRGDKEVKDCDVSTIPDSTQTCNKQPCNEDTLLPVSPSAPSIKNQLPYCDDDEDYPEVGLESELSTTMQADHPTKPSFAEFEVDLGSGSGSGIGDSELDWSPLDLEEGSGFIFNDTKEIDNTTTTETTESDTNATTTDSIEDENATTTVKPVLSSVRPTNPAYRGDIDYDEELSLRTKSTTDYDNSTTDDVKTTTDASNITTETGTETDSTDNTTVSTTPQDSNATTTELDDTNTTATTIDSNDTSTIAPTTTESDDTNTTATTIDSNDTSTIAPTTTESDDTNTTATTVETNDTSTIAPTTAESDDTNTTATTVETNDTSTIAPTTAESDDTNTTATTVESNYTSTIAPTTTESNDTTATTVESNDTSTIAPTTESDDTNTTATTVESNDTNPTTESGNTTSIDETSTKPSGPPPTTKATNPAYKGDDDDEETTGTTVIPTTSTDDANASTPTLTTDDANATTALDLSTTEDVNATTITATTSEDENATTIAPTTSEDENATTITPTTSEDVNATTITSTTSEDENATTIAPTTSEDENATTITPTTSEDVNATTITPTTSEDENATTIAPTTSADENATTITPTTSEDVNATTITPITSEDENATTIAPTTSEDENATTIAPTTSEDVNATTIVPTTSEDVNATTLTANTSENENATTIAPTTSKDENATTIAPTTSEDINATTIAPTTSEDENATTIAPTTSEDINATTIAPTTSEDVNATTAIPTTSEDVNATTIVPTTSEDVNATIITPTTSQDENATTILPTTSEDVNATTAVPTTYEDTNTTEEANATTITPTTLEDVNATTAGPTTSEGTSTTEDVNVTTAIPTTSEDENATTTTLTTSEDTNATTVIPTTFEDANTTATATETSETGTTSTDLDVNATTTESTTPFTTESTEGLLSSSSPVWIFTTPQLQCIPRPRKCKKTEFGCCPDGKTPASGPFDQGCRRLKTCNETEHGCCSDGVSVAAGPNEEGCPTIPCAETLFGCCLSDNETAAEGNDQEGCPPPCVASEFGCCADNETEASGPEKQGCPESSTTEQSTTFTTESTTDFTTESTTEFTTETERFSTTEESTPTDSTTETTVLTTALEGCAATQFGCCYDNETEASGPNGSGCPCNATEFGCCPDGVSAADGVGQEGCDGNCSLTKFGCCSDGQTPAHGPDSEGCCLTFTYGCCPDNLTPALGPHLEGCECKYSNYGCCPDNVTEAKGPNNQGCGCQYTTYGCCPDRRTAANGTDFAGCSCSTFQFGCCPDGVTHAIGPGQQGCHCQYSQYGCCGDEKTPATGPGGAGCDCTSSKFGCCVDGVTEASGPKFLGCVDVPHNPQAVCSLATDPGPCHDFVAYWYYDLQYGGCSRFWYGGCEGNGNRFATQEECEDVCVRPAPKDACKLPGVRGPCEGDHVRWYYNSTHEQCTPFRYGGCLGNANNYDTREVCQSHCEPETPADKCSLPIEAGPCAGNYSRWGFDKDTGSCEEFTWGGCEGNANRFGTEAACLAHCRPPGTLAPQCSDPPQEAGHCTDKQALWSFSTTENRCLPFYYTGCDGNRNRFDSRETCEALCPSSYEPDKCTLPADSGDCSNYREKWFYDTTNKRCRLFYFGGCGGNQNNFESEVECENTCSEAAAFFTTTTTTTVRPLPPVAAPTPAPAVASSDICQLPMQAGPCDDSLTRWFYDAASDSCSQFAYGGCQGNGNRFETRAECEGRCKQSGGTTPASIPGPEPSENQECITPSSLAPCGENVTTYYYDSRTNQCEVGLFGGCRYANSFSSPEECERRCGEFSSLSREQICTARLDPGPCRASFPKFYWDSALGKCDEFAYGGCNGGPNRFDTLDECEDFCGDLAPEPSCLQTLDQGRYCDQPSARRFYYSDARGECIAFVYLGCEGNENNFLTFEECATACRVIRPSDVSNEVPDCVAYDAECRSLQCQNGVIRVPVEDGCERCVCAEPPDCEPARQACEALDCSFGVVRAQENGCETCHCAENPCVAQNCSPQEQCMIERIIDSASKDIIYTARCVPDDNAIPPDCGAFQDECQRLQCPYGVQTTRLANGCERCSCITTETNCDILTEECNKLRCTYGIDRTTDADGCDRCSCSPDPCQNDPCSEGQRCVRIAYRDPFTQETRYSAECRAVNKPGFCPAEEDSNEDCRVECNDDADCRGIGKCCQVGCTRTCSLPVEATLPPLTTTYAPDVPRAPEAVPQQEPEVSASEGGKATLRCVFHGNPPPKITWTYGEVTIDGDQDRYRLLSDGSLEIVSLYRTDSGVYICVADNGLGVARQSITLIVKDPVESSAGISGDENAAVTGELGYPLEIRCLAYGYPPPMVSWTRESDGSMIPFNNAVYRARGNTLLIRRLDLHALGHYTCEAYNGIGVPASWRVAVQAFRPSNFVGENGYLVRRELIAPIQAYVTPEPTRETTTTTTTTTTTEPPPIPVFRVPVSTHIAPLRGPLTVGQDLQLTCEVDGYPDPQVVWTKDDTRIQMDDRITLSGSVSVSRLTVSRVSLDDAGRYNCYAYNQYGSYSDSTQVNINRGLVVPAKCTDNPFFANCDLIVHSNFCKHKYYSKFCCKSCVEAGQLDPEEAAMQADQPFRRK